MASFFVKEEPKEFEDDQQSTTLSQLDKNFDSEAFYLNNLNHRVLASNNDKDDIELLDEMMERGQVVSLNLVEKRRFHEISIEEVLENFEIANNPQSLVKLIISQDILSTKNKKANLDQKLESNLNKETDKLSLEHKRREKLAFEKKRILMSIVESARDKNCPTFSKLIFENHYEKLSVKNENSLLNKLNSLLENDDSLGKNLSTSQIFRLRRFRTKLEVRSLKRSKHIKQFDIDSYVNELIDSEKNAKLSSFKPRNRCIKREALANENQSTGQNEDASEETEDDSIIFENETLKESLDADSNTCEIVAVTRVLDRFNTKLRNFDMSFNQMPIGMVEFRNEDIKCVISPFSKK